MESTRILATSDLHGLLDGLRSECNKAKPDVLVIAGDIQPAVIGLDVEDWFKCTSFRMVRAQCANHTRNTSVSAAAREERELANGEGIHA